MAGVCELGGLQERPGPLRDPSGGVVPDAVAELRPVAQLSFALPSANGAPLNGAPLHGSPLQFN